MRLRAYMVFSVDMPDILSAKRRDNMRAGSPKLGPRVAQPAKAINLPANCCFLLIAQQFGGAYVDRSKSDPASRLAAPHDRYVGGNNGCDLGISPRRLVVDHHDNGTAGTRNLYRSRHDAVGDDVIAFGMHNSRAAETKPDAIGLGRHDVFR